MQCMQKVQNKGTTLERADFTLQLCDMNDILCLHELLLDWFLCISVSQLNIEKKRDKTIQACNVRNHRKGENNPNDPFIILEP